MKKSFSMFLLSSLFLFSGCAYRVKATYEYSLENVDNPNKIEFKKTPLFLVNSNLKRDTPFVFEDDFIKINWIPTTQEFNFKLQNKTNGTIKILWDSGAFITPDGANYRLINKNKKLNEEEGPTVPTPIMKTGFIEDLIYPVGFVSYYNSKSIGGYYVPSGWDIPPILPSYFTEDNEEQQEKKIEKLNESFLQKSIKILLPIEINNKVKEYIFIFRIENIYYKKL